MRSKRFAQADVVVPLMCNAINEQTNRGIALSLAFLATLLSDAWAQSLPSANSRASSDSVVSRVAAASEHESPQQRRGRFGAPEPGVYKARITPHWFQNDTRFWYQNDLRGGAKEFMVVDAEKGIRAPAFDHQKLAAALSKSAGQEFKADRLPFAEIEFIDGGRAIEFRAAEKTWRCNLSSYECTTVAGTAFTRGLRIGVFPRGGQGKTFSARPASQAKAGQ